MTRRTILAAGFAGGAALAARIQETRVISNHSPHFNGWATLVRRANGELLVAYSGGREAHVCPYGRVELIRSKDDGATWSFPEVLMDTPIDDRDAGICETPKGTLLVTTFTSLAYERTLDRNPAWQAVQSRTTAEQRKALLGTWMLRSTDGGMTWSAPFRVPVNSPHGPIALRDGRLLYPGKSLWAEDKVGVAESRDDGKTWRLLAPIPIRPGDKESEYHELHGVEAGDGRIVVHIRNHNPANDRETLQTVSTNGGKTWSVPKAIGVWGLPSHLLRLADNRLVMSYSYRRDPQRGNQARVSKDNGETWSDPILISTDGTADLGYPATAQLKDGSLLTVWYERLASNPKAVLRQARWTVD